MRSRAGSRLPPRLPPRGWACELCTALGIGSCTWPNHRLQSARHRGLQTRQPRGTVPLRHAGAGEGCRVRGLHDPGGHPLHWLFVLLLNGSHELCGFGLKVKAPGTQGGAQCPKSPKSPGSGAGNGLQDLLGSQPPAALSSDPTCGPGMGGVSGSLVGAGVKLLS